MPATATTRNRIVAALTATAVALAPTAVPQAGAISVSVRQSAHGQYLCSLDYDSADEAAADAVRAEYAAALKAASASVQEKYPEYASTFAKAADLGAGDLATLTKVPEFATVSVKLATAGYTAADILVILVGAQNPELLVRETVTTSLLGAYFPESSINRAIEYRDAVPAGNRAPLLSTAPEFSAGFRTVLAEHEAELKTAIEAFEVQAGNRGTKAAWQECIDELQARGVQPGLQPVPEIEVPLDPPSGTGTGSSTGAAVIIGLLALSALTVAAAYVANGGMLKSRPGLPFPLGR